ncbi:MAG: GNAT family N-acetyltransferase, partial [Sulfobacillus sp.]
MSCRTKQARQGGVEYQRKMVPIMRCSLFFQHFQETSYVVEENGQIIAFLIGFVSQTHPEQAYVHFVGVHPDYRKHGLAKELYDMFLAAVQARGCTEVHAVTSPVNKGSIAFHTKIGFEIEPGDAEIDGVQVKMDYCGRGQSRVRFVRDLVPKSTRKSDSVLIVIDVQVAMFDEENPVYRGTELLHNIQSMTDRARATDVPVIYIQHDGGEGSDLAHGSEGWQIHSSIAPRDGGVVIEKKTPDSFHGTTLDTMLRNQGVHR